MKTPLPRHLVGVLVTGSMLVLGHSPLSAQNALARPVQAGGLMPKPVLHWTFDDAGSNRIAEQSSRVEPGSAEGVQAEPGKVETAANFQTASSVIRIPCDLSAFQAGAFTIAFWTRLDKRPTEQYATMFYDNGNKGMVIRGKWDCLDVNTGGTWHTVTSERKTMPIGAWVHVAVTFDQGLIRVFINGVQVGSTPLEKMPEFGREIVLGVGMQKVNDGWMPDNTPLYGALDDLLIFDSALSPSMIEQLATK